MIRQRRIRPIGLAAVVMLAHACGPGRAPLEFPQPPGEAPEPELPSIPSRDGPLAVDLVYPPEDGAVAVRDSTFVFGSTGTGEARLTINGISVPVEPNGAFLAFLPVPPDGTYRLQATADGQTLRLERKVEVPEPPPSPPPDSAAIVAGSVFPRGAWAALPGERIVVGFRGTAGGVATLILPDGTRIPMVEEAAVAEAGEGARNFATNPAALTARSVGGLSDYRGFFAARPLLTADTAVALPLLAAITFPEETERPRLPERQAAAAAAAALEAVDTADVAAAVETADTVVPLGRPLGHPVAWSPHAEAALELVVAGDTARTPLPLNLALVDPDRPRVGIALEPEPLPESAGRVRAAPGPGYVYHYFWPNRTELTLTGERDGNFRVRLAPNLDAWAPTDVVQLVPQGTPPPSGAVGTVRFTHYADAVDVRLELDDRLPFRVDEGERSITITVYGGIGNTSWLQYGGLDPLIERAEWSQPADEVYALTLHLTQRPWGYMTFWSDDEDLVVRVRRPPEIDPLDPLRGLLIAVDPGHPPGGAIGPTRLMEAEANLAVALELRELLEDAGARVLMTRTDTSAVDLYERTQMAVEANADLFVSVHNNAFPDGVNPFENYHTIVYYFHPHSVDLAQALQRELFAELRLRDFGIGRSSLAVVRRPSWMPAALTESMFLMLPEQEAALRDEDVQERIARAHLRGIEAFLRGRAAEQAVEP